MLVPDIYGNNPAPEDVYRIAGDVQPGNSGGPLLTTDGQVAGVIFAKATGGSSLGLCHHHGRTWARSPPRRRAWRSAVSPGQCIQK